MVADQKNSEAYEFIEAISKKGLDLSYQILMLVNEKMKEMMIAISKCEYLMKILFESSHERIIIYPVHFLNEGGTGWESIFEIVY